MKLKDTEQLYVRSMGKALRVIAIFEDTDAANDYMARHDGAAVVAVFGKYILLAEKTDRGITIPRN